MTDPSRSGDGDLSQLQVKGTVYVAAALNGMSGVIALLTGLQFTTSASFYEPLYNALPWSLAALGLAQGGLALLVMRNGHGATIAVSFVALVVAVASVAWAVLAWSNGFGSPMAILLIPLAGSAAVVAPFALGPTRRARDARRRLQDAGMDLGF